MEKILSSQQIRELDSYTIQAEPISSLDLMERASKCVADRICKLFSSSHRIVVFAGPGNNGGDALAIARLLSLRNYMVLVYLCNFNNKLSADCKANKERLLVNTTIDLYEIITDFVPPPVSSCDVIIDGLFGTGLSRPLMGIYASLVKYINSLDATVMSIDIPSGLMSEDNSSNVMDHIVKADYTFTFQYNKLAFLFPENERFIGQLNVIDISMMEPLSDVTSTPYCIYSEADVAPILKKRSRFAHKGTYGHGCLIAGKKGMCGAAIMAAKSCMRSGVGKLTVHTPEANAVPLQITVPEVILNIEPSDEFTVPFETSSFNALAIGPGIGTCEATVRAFSQQLGYHKGPLVLDADALNIIGSCPDLMSLIPAGSILTPHKKELRGLIGTTSNSFEELQLTRRFAMNLNIYIIIKGANSAIVSPDGKVIYITTGNPGMATAGSGDVLTGIILSFLAQGYSSFQASILATYIHGLAGDIAADDISQESLIASDIIDYLPKAFRKLKI